MKMLQLILCGFFFLSCSNTPKNNSANSNNADMAEAKKAISWSKYNAGSQCGIEQALNVVITNQEELNSLWEKAFTIDMAPEKPTVDFSKKTVVALFLGMKNNGGHDIQISAIKGNVGDAIVIEAKHTLPGKNCMSTMAIEFPYFIAIADAKLDTKSKFNVTDTPVDCE